MSRIIPEAALQQHIAVLGKNGSGKTYAAKVAIVEPLLEQHRLTVVVDPTGAWWGLRSSRDGKGAGFSVLVLGGDHADLPLTPNGGAAVARLVTEQRVSLVADTSLMGVGERTRWFIDFAETLFRTSKSPVHLVLDEAHNFAPQGGGAVKDPMLGKMLHAANQLAAGGRLRGIRLTMITQRPQKLHKDMLTSADALIAMRVLHPLDRGAVKDWIDGCGDPAKGKEVLDSLASLQRGEGWVWYPEAKPGFLERMKFPAIKTFDSSATPAHGEARATPKGAATIDLTEIRAALADAVKEAEANDPKILRARIVQLEREAAKTPVAAPPDEKLLDEWWGKGHASGMATARDTYLGRFQQAIDAAVKIRDQLAKDLNPPGAVPRPAPAQIARPAHKQAQRELNTQVTRTMDGLTSPQQRVLDALAWWESIGVDGPDKGQVGFIAGYRVGKNVGGTFGNILGQLRSTGLIGYPAPNAATLTAEGRKIARQPAEAPTTEALQRAIHDRLDSPESRVLSALIDAYPEDLTKQECGARSGYTVGENVGGTFGNILGRLRSLGLIEYPSPGRVVALPVLFIQ
jgi:hypothetical protein